MHHSPKFPGSAFPSVLLIAIPLALGLSACSLQTVGATGAAGVMSRLGPIAAKCHGPITAVADVDESGSDRAANSPLNAMRLNQIKSLSDQVSACGGTETILIFSSSLNDSANIAYETYPASFGATTAARLIHNDQLETDLVQQVETGLPRALKQVGSDGTDVIAQFTLAKEVANQHPAGQLVLDLLTDGIATTGPVQMGNPGKFAATWDQRADALPLPNLSGADVNVIGIGRTAANGEQQPSTAYTEALLRFYQDACSRMHAQCHVTTTYTNGG